MYQEDEHLASERPTKRRDNVRPPVVVEIGDDG